jgi:hypothetical protein
MAAVTAEIKNFAHETSRLALLSTSAASRRPRLGGVTPGSD